MTDAGSSLPSRKRRRRLAALASYVLLTIVGLTMVMPFVWMLSTALKPSSQVTRHNWIPTSEFVRIGGAEREVLRRFPARDGEGLYRVRVVSSGARRGETMDVSTWDLTQEMGRQDRYALERDGQVLSVKLIEKLKPETLDVRVRAADGVGVENIVAPETEIVSRPAPRWSNFSDAWNMAGNFGRAYFNSIFIAVIITVGQVFTSSLAAYAFARLRFPGRDKLFLAYLATMMIPGAVTMVPLFVILKELPLMLNYVFSTDWFGSNLMVRWWLSAPVREFYAGKPIGLDSYFALIVPGLFSAYGTFMLRQFFLTIPRDLEDAARIDGCGTWGVYRHVVMPLSKPAVATIGILTFMSAWRYFMWPMVVASSPEMYTLPVMLQSFMGATGTQWELLMAGTLIVMAPMIAVFLLGQRYFIRGIRMGALKG